MTIQPVPKQVFRNYGEIKYLGDIATGRTDPTKIQQIQNVKFVNNTYGNMLPELD